METDGLGVEETKPRISLHSKVTSGGISGFQKVGRHEHVTPLRFICTFFQLAINVRSLANISIGRASFARIELITTVSGSSSSAFVTTYL